MEALDFDELASFSRRHLSYALRVPLSGFLSTAESSAALVAVAAAEDLVLDKEDERRKWTDRALQECYGEDLANAMQGKAISDSATLAGNKLGLTTFLDLFLDEMAARESCAGIAGADQAIHNVLLQVLLEAAVAGDGSIPSVGIEIDRGTIVSNPGVSSAADQTIKGAAVLNDEDLVLNADDHLPALVHQWHTNEASRQRVLDAIDRLAPMARRVEAD
eukprot:scaffold7815_cov248-Pinguiococcus_pyrenoidosus.AAC.2